MKRVCLLIICSLLYLQSLARSEEHMRSPYPDEVTIGAMTIERIGKEIIIRHKLLLGDNVRWCKTRLIVSLDGGETFSFRPSFNSVSGDIGKQSTSGDKCIRYNIKADKEKLAGKQLIFKVDIVSKDVLKTQILTSAQVSVFPHMSYGFMFGMVKNYGGYIKARSDFNFIKSSYNCNTSGEIEGGGHIWTDGTSKTLRYTINAGAMFRAARWFYPYVGLGYGERNVLWRDFQENWARVSDLSCSGVSLDAGFVLKFGKVSSIFCLWVCQMILQMPLHVVVP